MLYAVLGLIFLFFAVILVRAAMFEPKPQPPVSQEEVTFDKAAAVENLAQLIRCKTISYSDHSLEDDAEFRKLLDMLPEDLRPYFTPYVKPNEASPEWTLVKAADRISAYLKCIEEEKMGNRDFLQAKATIADSLMNHPLPEVREFMRTFVHSYTLSPDELSR